MIQNLLGITLNINQLLCAMIQQMFFSQITNFFLPFVMGTFMCWQSFVVALLAIVIATFSTGIDSQCFQVCPQSPHNFSIGYRHFHKFKSNNTLQLRKSESPAEDDVPYGYGFFHFVFATGAMYFAMLLIGWNTHHTIRKYVPLHRCQFLWIHISSN